MQAIRDLRGRAVAAATTSAVRVMSSRAVATFLVAAALLIVLNLAISAEGVRSLILVSGIAGAVCWSVVLRTKDMPTRFVAFVLASFLTFGFIKIVTG